jgi:hypothetical protein
MLEANRPDAPPADTLKAACAFVATSFGFGPVSKAVSLAQELKSQAPQLEAHYFGAGIDYDYAHKSGAFDRLFRVNVDRLDALAGLVPQLKAYRAVVSVLNLDLLPLWRRGETPLYFVDSLTWMWSSLPAGVENVAAYFVQDYMLPTGRIRQWAEKLPLVLVAPIETTGGLQRVADKEGQRRLLVNFSGCSNPFASPELYEKYALSLTWAILEAAASRFEEIVLCCNERLAGYLRERFGNRARVRIGLLSHEEFLRLLVSSALVLSAPGITTTLEALAARVPVRFLLPQNDSQALLSERYRSALGDDACMAFSRFGDEFAIPPFISEAEAVRVALAHLENILDTRQPEIRAMIRRLLAAPSSYNLDQLADNITRRWEAPGQQAIVAHLLSRGPDEVGFVSHSGVS